MKYGGQAFTFGKEAAASTNEKDSEMLELIRDVPELHSFYPYVALGLNFFIPGVGTILAACVSDPKNWSKMHISIGLVQMLTSIYLIGWIWAIYWGVLIVLKSFKSGGESNPLLATDAPKSDSMVQNNA